MTSDLQQLLRNAVIQLAAFLRQLAADIADLIADVLATLRRHAERDCAVLLAGRDAPLPRPPARIDPGRGISTVPQGRPVFRPARTY